MRITVDADFPDGLIRELKERVKRARDYPKALERAAVELQGRAREHASGRPGPNIITWQFWSAYTYAVSGDDAVVGNGSVYANRLEYGFVGVDSIGRHYNQPPYPSLGPAVMRSEDLLPEELRKVVFR